MTPESRPSATKDRDDDLPMRVFVGCSENDMIPAKVLEHSIRKHASRPVEFVPMLQKVARARHKKNRAVTRFTFKRFQIPALAGYRGRALYMDSDMQMFADLAELWRIPFGEHQVLCSVQLETPERWRNADSNFHPGRHFAFMLLDCSRLEWDADDIVRRMDEGEYTYKELTKDLCIVPSDAIGETIAPEWNSLEKYEPGVTKNLHYTVIRTQPWRYPGNPLEEVWMREFREVVREGGITLAEVLHAIQNRWVRPELADAWPDGRAARERLGFRIGTVATRAANEIKRALWRGY